MAENEAAFLAPFDERDRQAAPNLGYVPALTIQEHPTGVKKSGVQRTRKHMRLLLRHRALGG